MCLFSCILTAILYSIFMFVLYNACSGILLGVPLYSSCNPNFPAAVKPPIIQNPIIVEQMSEMNLSALIVICSG